jgi:1-aminocyclopropane-1-carboxylate deaminase/D-cysteine desulfhydrase-like pyridoxal-dependent ACC family enzyme
VGTDILLDRATAAADLRARTAKVPRIHLACLPTPFHEMPRLAALLGGPRLFIKRDDLTGLALGGNKVRNWEFRLPELVGEGTQVAILALDLQSNSARQSTAACALAGIRTILVLEGIKPETVQGNLLLDYLMGAEVHFAADRAQQRILLDALAQREAAQGRRATIVTDRPRFEHSSSFAYILSLLELLEQAEAQGVAPRHIYISSAGKALAGMVMTEKLLHAGFRVHAVPATREWDVPQRTAAIAAEVSAILGLPGCVSPADVCSHDEFVGDGYGIPSQASIEAVKLFARTEGIVLDPVYTGKAAAALIAHVRDGTLGSAETAVLVHTGGMPAVFTHPRLWLDQDPDAG